MHYENVSCFVIGNGLIGTEVAAQVREVPGWEFSGFIRPDAFVEPDGTHTPSSWGDSFGRMMKKKRIENPVVAFLAIPSKDGGRAAHQYLRDLASSGFHAVTCEKGALANFFKSLREYVPHIGCSATVGGGTGLLASLQSRMIGRPGIVVHSVLNGSLNYLMDTMASTGLSLERTYEQAQALGILDPGAVGPLDAIFQEMRDTAMKTAIVHNVCLNPDDPLYADRVIIRDARNNIDSLLEEVRARRYVVSFIPEDRDADLEDTIGGFTFRTSSGWTMHAGFRRVGSEPALLGRLPRGAGNCIITDEGRFGTYLLASGPGAGPAPTAAAMVRDAKRLLQRP